MNRFASDTPLVSEVMPSPNHGERRGGAHPAMLVLHYTGMKTAAEALARLCDPASEVSAHYVVLEDGRIIQCVAENRRAWHAGVSWWRGHSDINSRSIGIELVNPGHEHGYRDFPDPQIDATIALCRDIVARHRIDVCDVVGHSDIAPSRKMDPGERFPWKRLADAGGALWVEPDVNQGLAPLHEAEQAWAALAAYGYAVPPADDHEGRAALVLAFQRRFRPMALSGVMDAGTAQTALRLLTASSKLASATFPPQPACRERPEPGV